jgi:hypothetical protein
MRVLTRGVLCVGALVLLGSPSRVAAQAKQFELGPFAGWYLPTKEEGLQTSGNRDVHRRGSIAFGGRFTYWTTKSLGLELTGGFSPARVSVQSTVGRFPHSTDLLMGSGKVVLNLIPTSSSVGLVVGGGVAVLHVNKSVIDPTKSKTNIGGIGSAGLRIPVFGRAVLRGDVDAYLYNGDFGLGSKFTQDLVFSGGLSVRF